MRQLVVLFLFAPGRVLVVQGGGRYQPQFTVQNLQERLDGLAADPWQDFLRVKQSLTAAMLSLICLK